MGLWTQSESSLDGITRRTALRGCAAWAAMVAGCSGANGSAGDSTITSTPRATPIPEPCESDPTITSDDPLTVSFNSREMLRCHGRTLESFDRLGDWEVKAGSVAYKTDHSAVGHRIGVLNAGMSDDRARIVRRYDGIDLSDRDISLTAKLERPLQESLYVQLLAPDRENRLVMKHPIQHQWGWTTLDMGPTREVGNPDLTDVREIRIGVYTGGGIEASVRLDALRTTRRVDGGSVCLTFDDNKASQYDVAFPVLAEYGLPGVAGVIPWSVDEREVTMTTDQLYDLHDAGWEIVSHPQRPKPLPELSADEQLAAIRRSKRWLIEHAFEDGARFVIWPFGEFDPATLRIASRYHYLGLGGGYCPSGQRFAGPLTLTRLNANDASIEDVQRIVDLAAKYDQFLAITFHQIGRSQEQVSERTFEELIHHIDRSDLDVVTVSELWEQRGLA